MMFANYTSAFATFSEDRTRRYSLFRQWDITKPVAMIIGLNPSTANGNDDDPTIGFVYRVLTHNGYGGFFMLNLFTMIATNPKDLIIDFDWQHAKELWAATKPFCNDVIFAWGRFKTHGRELTAIRMFTDALCFGKLKNGEPRHPMYLKATTKLIPYR